MSPQLRFHRKVSKAVPSVATPWRPVVPACYKFPMASTAHGGVMHAASGYGHFETREERAWRVADCPSCGSKQTAVIAFVQNGDPESVQWLRCVNCGRGLVDNDGVLNPGSKPFSLPQGLRGIELAAWGEVRDCLSVNAHTAAVMMCRKILLHVAVGHGLPAKDGRGRAPNFASAIRHLTEEGLITKKMQPWVDRIKDVGNEANHEIEAIDRATAMDVARFTEQLLRLAYEMGALMERKVDDVIEDPPEA